MIAAVRNTLNQFHMIDNGDRVLVGLSGGADSVALLLNLCKYRLERQDFTLTAIHINHNLRETALRDQSFAESLCESLDVPLIVRSVDVKSYCIKHHLSTEEAARELRYREFASLNMDKIAVGHHMNDVAETVIMNICRGSGIHGLCGIAPVNGRIIRPLINISRNEIEAYLTRKNVSFCVDETNLSTDYTRNKIRLEVLPYLSEKINDRAIGHIANMGSDALLIEDFIESELSKVKDMVITVSDNSHESDMGSSIIDGESIVSNTKATAEHSEAPGINEHTEPIVTINRIAFLACHELMQRELILKAFSYLTPHRKDITRRHVDAVCSLFTHEGSATLDLPYNLYAQSGYESVIIRAKAPDDSPSSASGDTGTEINISIDTQLLTREGSLTIKLPDFRTCKLALFPKGNEDYTRPLEYTKCFDYDKINNELCIRTRRSGDYIVINDKGDRQSVKAYMINAKIDRLKRDKVLLLASGKGIIWVMGHRISADVKVSESTTRILMVEVD